MEQIAKSDRILDLRGVSCPWSILKAKSQLIGMEPGEVLEVLATDPLMSEDFPKVLGRSGHQVIQIVDEDPEFSRLYVRRGHT